MQHEQGGAKLVVQRKGVASQPQRSKYVFAVRSAAVSEDEQTKVCPRCGEVLFSDMDVCYGCLYDFTRDSKSYRSVGKGLPTEAPELTTRVPLVDDSLDSIAIDEIDDEGDDDTKASSKVQVKEDELSATHLADTQMPRHRRKATSDLESADATLDLSVVAADEGVTSTGLSVLISSPTIRVCIPVPDKGLLVGRDESNDIVLRSRTVSRNHLRLVPQGGSLVIEDLGATNPTLLLGTPVSQQSQVYPGQSVVICDTTLTVVGQQPSLAVSAPTMS